MKISLIFGENSTKCMQNIAKNARYWRYLSILNLLLRIPKTPKSCCSCNSKTRYCSPISKSGEKLPSEREMSQQFSTSKTAVHDAVCELERKGFVEVVPRKGVYIADYLRTGTIETFFALLRFNGGKLDENTTKSIIDLRRFIELPSIDGAIDNLDGEKCSALDSILQKGLHAADEGDAHAFAECLFEFTREVCIQSKNLITPMLFNAFRPLTIPFWEESLRRNGIEYGRRVLTEYYDAVQNCDVQKAKSVVNADLNNFLS